MPITHQTSRRYQDILGISDLGAHEAFPPSQGDTGRRIDQERVNIRRRRLEHYSMLAGESPRATRPEHKPMPPNRSYSARVHYRYGGPGQPMHHD